jgi:type IV pilus assembly protein PilA
MQKNRLRRGFSLIELLIVIAIILILAGIASVQVNKQLMSAHETAAIRTIKVIHEGELGYNSQFGRFAQNLIELGPAPSGGADSPAAAGLLPKNLAEGKGSGYVFTVTGTPTGYTISAVPEAFGRTGSKTFFSDETMVIRSNFTAEPATVASPAIK